MTTDDVGPSAIRPVQPAMRRLLMVFTVLTLLGCNQLFVLSQLTDAYFAWTLDPPLSAAFLGAGYGAGFVLVVLTLRARFWANARVPTITVLVFTVFTLAATLLHLDRFHFGAPGVIARFAAWFWIAIYLTVPVALLVLVPRQERQPGDDPQRSKPLPAWLASVLVAQGGIMLVVGVILFAVPATGEVLWPWALAPLSARAIAAWLIAFGCASLLALRERDLERLEIPAVAYTLFGVLELVAVARYGGQVQWNEASAWVYVGLLVTIVATGAYGWWAGRPGRQAQNGSRAFPSRLGARAQG